MWISSRFLCDFFVLPLSSPHQFTTVKSKGTIIQFHGPFHYLMDLPATFFSLSSPSLSSSPSPSPPSFPPSSPPGFASVSAFASVVCSEGRDRLRDRHLN